MLFTLFYLSAHSQVVKGTTQYQSAFDRSLTLKRLSFLDSVDNVNGIYARVLDDRLETLLKNDHQFDLIKAHIAGPLIQPEDLVTRPEDVRSLSANIGADGFLIAQARKDPKALKLQLYLFSINSGELIAEETQMIAQEKTEVVLKTLEDLYVKVKKKLPYDALILSRTDNRVTINAGTKDGVRAGSDLNAVSIISAKTHPKRHFLLETKKAILGQVRVVKADDYLSFADVISEVEAGVLNADIKITGIRRVQHDETSWTRTHTPPSELLSKDNTPVFGKNSKEWVTVAPPTFGKVGAQFSLGRFDNNLSLTDGTNPSSKVQFYPRININGEIWVTPKLYIDASFSQGIGQASNPLGSPSEISSSLTQYQLAFGYNFMLKDDFFGPKLTVDVGLGNYRMFMDTVSQLGFTTLEYRSVPIGLGGYVPIDPKGEWGLSAKAYFHLFPSLKESPFSSGGGPDNTINQFLFHVEKKMSARLKFKMGLEFLLLSTNFNGAGERVTPATNLSHRFTFFTTGIDYMF